MKEGTPQACASPTWLLGVKKSVLAVPESQLTLSFQLWHPLSLTFDTCKGRRLNQLFDTPSLQPQSVHKNLIWLVANAMGSTRGGSSSLS